MQAKTKRKAAIFVPLALVAALMLILAACSGQGAENTGTDAGNEPEEAAAPGDAGFQEFPIGEPQEVEGMNVAGVYFQAVDMEPSEKAGLGPDKSDIHIEADISVLKNNKTGFGAGEWMPNLTVAYKVKNEATGEQQEGSLMPMNASDGPHYGANIKMGDAGKYKVTFVIESPEKQDYLLHVDKETGVPGRFWKKPIEVSWDFNYVPLDK